MTAPVRRLVLAALLLVGCGNPGPTIDPQVGTKLAANITATCQTPAPDWCAALLPNPVEMQGTIAFVHFADGYSPIGDATPAMQVCADIAAITNDPDTARPLGITSVVITANGKTLAQCYPPAPTAS